MNKSVGEELGGLLGRVTDVCCDVGGTAIRRYIRIRAWVNIRNPLLRWTNVNLGGTSDRVFFHYEKLVDF